MPTVQNRLFAKRIILSPEQKTELGRFVNTAFQNAKIQKPIFRRESKEKHGTFKVCDYPPEFTPLMDKVIQVYCEHRNVRPMRQRKPINHKKPAYSTRNPFKNR